MPRYAARPRCSVAVATLAFTLTITGCVTDAAPTAPVRLNASVLSSPIVYRLTSNDPASIQAWYNNILWACAAEVRGEIGAGDFHLDQQYEFRGDWGCSVPGKRIEIVGQGAGATRLHQYNVRSDGLPYNAFMVGQGYDATFDSLSFHSSGRGDLLTSGGNAIVFHAVSAGAVRNSRFYGWGTSAVKAMDAQNIVIEDNYVQCALDDAGGMQGPLSMGLWIQNLNVAPLHGYHTARRNTIANCRFEAIDIEGVSSNVVEHNTITCNTGADYTCNHGIALVGRYVYGGSCPHSPASNNTVSWNGIYNTKLGIQLYGDGRATGNTLYSNGIYDTQSHGIQISHQRDGARFPCSSLPSYSTTNHAWHSGNVVQNNHVQRAGQAGLWIGGNSSQVLGNLLEESQEQGAYVESDGNTIRSNRMLRSGYTGLYLSGANNRYSNTSGYDGVNEASGNAIRATRPEEGYGMLVRGNAGNDPVGYSIFNESNKFGNFMNFY